ncbi:MAG: hypothetical protein KME26_05275 [Oscillatoria princeps RMCB-10]|nr:hypothetical protein [Oscillatoria princeps RMCB-10]
MLTVLSLAQAWIAIGEGVSVAAPQEHRTSTLGESLTISGEFRPKGRVRTLASRAVRLCQIATEV